MIKEKLEEKISRTERKLRELSLHTQRLSHEYEKLLETLDLTSEQLKDFAENPENFSPSIREEVQNEKKRLEEKLNLELNHVHNANQTQKTFLERGTVQQHWLFVR